MGPASTQGNPMRYSATERPPFRGDTVPRQTPQNIGRALQGVKANAHRANQLHQGYR